MHTPTLDTVATLEHIVVPEDAPLFSGELIHPVYGTAAAVRDMEHAARLCLLPLLEEGEFGVGREVHIRHRRPLGYGSIVLVEARITGFTRNTLRCDITSRHRGELVADGFVVQGILRGSGLMGV